MTTLMPFRLRYEIYDGIRKAAVYSTNDRLLARIERDDRIRRGGGIYSIKTTITPDNMNKSEEYVYLVYEVRQLEKKYFNEGRDKAVFKQALEKESELDKWNEKTRSYLTAHPGMELVKAGQPEFAFFQIVEQWRKLWKEYFAYKRSSDANPAIVRERAKQCRDYETNIDNYIKKTIGLL